VIHDEHPVHGSAVQHAFRQLGGLGLTIAGALFAFLALVMAYGHFRVPGADGVDELGLMLLTAPSAGACLAFAGALLHPSVRRELIGFGCAMALLAAIVLGATFTSRDGVSGWALGSQETTGPPES
jgi:hypothetical protein